MQICIQMNRFADAFANSNRIVRCHVQTHRWYLLPVFLHFTIIYIILFDIYSLRGVILIFKFFQRFNSFWITRSIQFCHCHYCEL